MKQLLTLLFFYFQELSCYQRNLTQSAVKLALLRASGRRGLLTKLQQRCHGEISANQLLRDIASKLQTVHTAADGILQAEMGRWRWESTAIFC
jgi:hypothetical protein